MQYTIHYLDSRGEPSQLKIDAKNHSEARLLSRIPERRILSIHEDFLGRLTSKLATPVPSLKNQAIFLQNLSSSFATGKPVKEAVIDLIEKSTWIRVKKDKLQACEELSDYLKLLNFNENSILLAETAKRTGQYSFALHRASRYLIDREKVGSEVAKEIRLGLVYVVLGFIFFTMMPFFLDYAIQEIQLAVGGKFVGNGLTHLIILWGAFLRNFWFILIALCILGFIYREFLLIILKRLPIFKTLDYKLVLDRSFRFLSAYEILNEAGIIDSRAILALLESSRGTDRKVYRRIYAKLINSEDLAQAFSDEDWPIVVKDAIANINKVDIHQKKIILNTVKETVEIENVHIARVLARYLSRLGFCMMLLAVLGATIGFYVPIASMASHMGV